MIIIPLKFTLNNKRFKKGATISYLNNKYGITSTGLISTWSKKYDEGKLGVDNRGRRKL